MISWSDGTLMQVTVNVTCTAPFLQSPKVQLGYNHAGEVCNQNLPLPITTTKFVTPPDSAIPRDAFFNRWRALTGETLFLSCEGRSLADLSLLWAKQDSE